MKSAHLRALLLAVLALGAMAAFAASANAAEYIEQACPTPNDASGWSHPQTAATFTDNCARDGSVDISMAPGVTNSVSVNWSSLGLVELDSYSFAYTVHTPNPGLTLTASGGQGTETLCSTAAPCAAGPFTASGLGSGGEPSSFLLQMRCLSSCSGTGTDVSIGPVLLTLNDRFAPTVGTVSGSLTTSDAKRGTVDLVPQIGDHASGLRRVATTIDGRTAYGDGTTISDVSESGGTCDPIGSQNGLSIYDGVEEPCPTSLTPDISIDTTRLSEGKHTIVVQATDAAGNTATVYSHSFEVDNVQAPANTFPADWTDGSPWQNPVVGDTLTVDRGTWSGTDPLFTYMFNRCFGSQCTPVQIGASTTYTVMPADVGSQIEDDVTASNSAGTSTIHSSLTGVVAAASGI